MSQHNLVGSQCAACPQSWSWGKFHDVFGTASDSDDSQDNPTLRFLVDHELVFNHISCPKDHSHGNCRLRLNCNLGTFRCRKSGHPEFSVSRAKNTLMKGAHISSRRVMGLAFLFCEDATYEQIKRHGSDDGATLGDDTIIGWFTTFREVTAELVALRQQQLGPIGGPGKVVQVDETACGHRKYNRGRLIKEKWVFGCIEGDAQEGSNEVRLIYVKKRDKDTLKDAISKFILPGSVVHSDCWKAYVPALSSLGMVHETVNHSDPRNRFVSPFNVHTQRIEATWRPFKEWMRHKNFRENQGDGHYQWDLYLSEYLWRRYCRLNGIDLFAELLRGIKICFPGNPLC